MILKGTQTRFIKIIYEHFLQSKVSISLREISVLNVVKYITISIMSTASHNYYWITLENALEIFRNVTWRSLSALSVIFLCTTCKLVHEMWVSEMIWKRFLIHCWTHEMCTEEVFMKYKFLKWVSIIYNTTLFVNEQSIYKRTDLCSAVGWGRDL